MMDRPLLISSILEFAATNHGEREIVTKTTEGGIHRYTYEEAELRSRKLAQALQRLGVELGDPIATIAWNTYRHFEIYYGVSGIGAICHTLNPRLHPEQIAYITNHAEDKLIFVDLTFLPLVEALQSHMKTIKGVVVMTSLDNMPETKVTEFPVYNYEALIEAEDGALTWPEFDENTASSLCYTSGTTGNPKGVLYSHRSTVLHSYAANMGDALGLKSTDSVLPVVPMFHANAWGLPYAIPMVGAKLVLPGPHLDGQSLQELMEGEGVTFSSGVPTIWLGLLQHLRASGKRLDCVNTLTIGGSACPLAIMEGFKKEYDCDIIHGWGMTEMSPVGTLNTPKPGMENQSVDERLTHQLKQGRGIFGVDMKIVGDDGEELPHDGKAFGPLKVRGYWVSSAYMKGEGGEAFDADGWFDTGDVATIDPDGYMQITDRTKDVIKSGGEWISSIDLENAALSHPDLMETAVIAVAHPKWDERPLLICVKNEGADVDKDSVLKFLDGKIAKWWTPDDVVFVDELPHGATGKILKSKLREQYEGYKLPTI